MLTMPTPTNPQADGPADEASSPCPGCGLELPEDDLAAQSAHMQTEHPEIIAERVAEAAKWDGWEQD
jgi:hypothetical protein